MPPPDATSDRDERWFEAIYREHHAAVLAYAQRRTEDSDDVVAEVFSTAWRSRDRVPDPVLPWLYRTASNHVLHVYRTNGRQKRLGERAAALGEAVPDPADAIIARLDTGGLVRQAFERLSPSDRELLTLLAWEELTREQLAYVLDCSAVALRVRIKRARARFTRELQELDERSSPQPPLLAEEKSP